MCDRGGQPGPGACRRCPAAGRQPVGFKNPARGLNWGYAAVPYLLMRPPRIFVRVIRGAGNGMTFSTRRLPQRIRTFYEAASDCRPDLQVELDLSSVVLLATRDG